MLSVKPSHTQGTLNMNNYFFAGLESFMEDDKTIDLSPEAQDAVDQAIDATEERADAESEIASAEVQMRAQLMALQQLASMKQYVETYGVDRSFMRMFNSNGELSAFLKSEPFASCESFDIQGDPRSPESIAMCESISSIMNRMWEGIKANFFSRWTPIRRWMQSIFQSASTYKKQLIDLKSKIKSASYEGELKCMPLSSFEEWRRIDSDKLRNKANDILKSITRESKWDETAENEVAELKRDISRVDDFDTSTDDCNLSEFKSKLPNMIQWAIDTCDSVNKCNETYAGYWKTGMDAKFVNHLGNLAEKIFGPSPIGAVVASFNTPWTLARQSWALMNTTTDTDMQVVKNIIRIAKAVTRY